jgi:CDP-glycerol glycerophosphotransferase
MAEALPERARLLVRLHRNVAERPVTTPDGFVVDVSDHPEIAELYLAADVLVSDYSSAVYDFAVTGKPVILYAPDLDRYRDTVRGLYFDYEEWAPGPVATTQEQLGAALAALPGHASEWSQRYEAFVQRFCPHEDGHAGERVVQRLASVLDG